MTSWERYEFASKVLIDNRDMIKNIEGVVGWGVSISSAEWIIRLYVKAFVAAPREIEGVRVVQIVV